MLLDKYVDFIDVYAEVQEDEREALYREISAKEETAMLAQYIKDKGFQEGKLEGKCILLERQLALRFGPLPAWVRDRLAAATSEQLDRWAERVLDAGSIREVLAE